MVSMIPTSAVCIEKSAAMSDNRPTGTNSVVLNTKAAMASNTTRSQAVLRETVVGCMRSQVSQYSESDVAETSSESDLRHKLLTIVVNKAGRETL